MKTVGIIAEYNPFHKGHEYHIKKAREITGADYVVIVMGGDFMQRGEPALADKHLRTLAALQGGADLVLELPVQYATGSAEDFASGSVSVLTALCRVDFLCFGSEEGSIEPLMEYARIFEEEPAGYRELLRDNLREGLSFPAARNRAAVEYMNYTARIMPCCADDADCRGLALPSLSRPNDILGVEYLRALIRNDSAIKPVTIKRTGSPYGDPGLASEYPSAMAVRKSLSDGQIEAAYAAVPDYCAALLTTADLMYSDDFSASLSHLLLTLDKNELAGCQDVGEDLASRIYNLRYSFTGFSEFADLVKTRQITHTRVTRALTHILLGLGQEDAKALRNNGYPVYLHALGFRESARPLLRRIKSESSSALIVKSADAENILSAEQYGLFQKTVQSADIYEMTKALKYRRQFREELTVTPVIIP